MQTHRLTRSAKPGQGLAVRMGLAAVAALGLAACEGHAKDVEPPNVILISLDTLRADHLDPFGYARKTSPRIGALAEDGLVFEQVYSQSPKTAPSHMTILTGLFPESHGIQNLSESQENRRLSDSIPTLATVLNDEGYSTYGVTGGGHMVANLGFDQGFEAFVDQGGGEQIFFNASDAIAEHGDNPYFLFVHTYQIHDPYTPPRNYREMWGDPEYDGKIIGDHAQLKEVSGEDWADWHRAYWERVDQDSPADIAQLESLYDAGIRYTDDLVGRFLDRLEERGQLQNTIVIVLSDHGEEFLEHGRFLHDSMYQEVLHVPLVIHLPESLRNERTAQGIRRVGDTVRLVDVLPTILELVGSDIPGHVQGVSLLEIFGNGDRVDRPVVSHWPEFDRFAYRRENWKLVQDERNGGLELFDLNTDPNERLDRSAAAPDVLEGIVEEFEELRTHHRGTFVQFEPGAVSELSEENIAELEALGYIVGDAKTEGENSEDPNTADGDPKESGGE